MHKRTKIALSVVLLALVTSTVVWLFQRRSASATIVSTPGTNIKVPKAERTELNDGGNPAIAHSDSQPIESTPSAERENRHQVASADSPPTIAAPAESGGAPVAAGSEEKRKPEEAEETIQGQVHSEIAGTARMIDAHASLRTPEVVNPDSESNRRVLQTMVAKALARSAVVASPNSP